MAPRNIKKKKYLPASIENFEKTYCRGMPFYLCRRRREKRGSDVLFGGARRRYGEKMMADVSGDGKGNLAAMKLGLCIA